MSALGYVLVAGVAVFGADAGEGAMPYSVDQIRNLLVQNADAPLTPELSAQALKGIASTPRGEQLTEWIHGAIDEPIPATTYTDYREYRRIGDRGPYQRTYFDKRTLLTKATLAAMLDDGPANMNRVNDLLWNICDEFTWVLPAHEKPQPWTIDLFAAESGAEMAHVLRLLDGKLSVEVVQRVRHEIEARLMTPYLEHAHEYWWDSGRNNWTGVCAGSLGEIFLLLEPDPARQAQAVALVLDQLTRFIDVGFEPDGGCLEGIGYWNYGLFHYVIFGEMLRNRTGGQIDLLANEKLGLIARYPLVVALDKHVFASFSDSHPEASVHPMLAAKFAERTGETALLEQVGDWDSWRLTTVLRDLLWWDGAELPATIADAFLPASGIGKRVVDANGLRAVLCAKAGHNAEPHNNNDVGSFIYRVGDTTWLCDPGGGLYNRDYFSPKRYENAFAASYGHSVPVIGGKGQVEGAQWRGTMAEGEAGALVVDFADAYDVPELASLVRTFHLNSDGTLVMEDVARFEGAGLEFQEALITWLDAEAEGPVVRLRGEKGALEIRSEDVAFEVERLEEASRANHAEGTLSRITATWSAAPEIHARFVMTYVPAE